MIAVIRREKSITKYQREWKINLIECDNPHRNDLYMALYMSGSRAAISPGQPCSARRKNLRRS
jgi:hypothetical protein